MGLEKAKMLISDWGRVMHVLGRFQSRIRKNGKTTLFEMPEAANMKNRKMQKSEKKARE